MKTLHVEDRVTIRAWDDMISEFGFDEHGSIKTRWPYVKGMKSLCGNTYEIYRIDVENNKYGLTAGGANIFIRNFSKDMFEECKHTTLFNKILKIIKGKK